MQVHCVQMHVRAGRFNLRASRAQVRALRFNVRAGCAHVRAVRFRPGVWSELLNRLSLGGIVR